MMRNIVERAAAPDHRERVVRGVYDDHATVAVQGHASDRHRQPRRRRVRPLESGGAAPEWLVHADEADRSLSSVVVSDALASLSRPHREVLVELYFRGSRVDDAAAALGIPPGTVKSRGHYAMRALRLALLERGVTGPG